MKQCWITTMFAALLSLLLPGCDAISLKELKPGVSTEAEVRSRLGKTTGEYKNPDGSWTLEFSRQPEGIHCYMVTVNPDRVMVNIEQVLTEANFARIVSGLSRDEVRRMLGKPASIQTYLKPEEVWDWKVEGVIPTEEKHFHVHFDPASGKVITTSGRVAQKG